MDITEYVYRLAAAGYYVIGAYLLMLVVVGIGLLVVVLFPNTLKARGIIAATSGSIFLIGWLMNRAGRAELATSGE